MNRLIADNNYQDKIVCDSAGTSDAHEGQRADQRMARSLSLRGYSSTSYSRPIIAEDFQKFDYIIAMDFENLNNLRAIAPNREAESRVHLMSEYAMTRKEKIVPDPYYGGPQGFDLVIDILEDACLGLLKHIEKNDLIKT